MLKILSIFVTVILIVLFPPAVLAFISNNAVPGDLTYPIKRKLEDGILAVASFNPTTKAYFQINRSDRRFKEATVLIRKNDTKTQISLNNLTDQVSFTINDLKKITDNSQKKQLAQQLSESINEYDQTLANYQQESANSEIAQNTNPLIPSGSNQNPTPSKAQTSPALDTLKPSESPPTLLTVKKSSPSPSPTVFRSPQATIPPTQKNQDDQQRQIDEARKKLEEQQRQLEEIRRLLAAQQNQPDNIGEIKQPSPTTDTSLESDTNITLDFNGLKNALSNINIDDLNALVP